MCDARCQCRCPGSARSNGIGVRAGPYYAASGRRFDCPNGSGRSGAALRKLARVVPGAQAEQPPWAPPRRAPEDPGFVRPLVEPRPEADRAPRPVPGDGPRHVVGPLDVLAVVERHRLLCDDRRVPRSAADPRAPSSKGLRARLGFAVRILDAWASSSLPCVIG